MRRVARLLRWVAGALAATALAWLAGLGWFLHQGFSAAADPGTETDAIVVLTGGRLRLESGVDLLEAGKAHKMFVSGVNQRVDREALLRILGPLPNSASCCIVLGHEADNTFGNARETAGWMRHEGYRSLRLVTSWYHMPRSLLEFRRAIPEVVLVAHPVFPAHASAERWWTRAHAATLVIGEYHKYLAAELRPVLAPLRRWAPWLPSGETAGEAVTTAAGRQ